VSRRLSSSNGTRTKSRYTRECSGDSNVVLRGTEKSWSKPHRTPAPPTYGKACRFASQPPAGSRRYSPNRSKRLRGAYLRREKLPGSRMPAGEKTTHTRCWSFRRPIIRLSRILGRASIQCVGRSRQIFLRVNRMTKVLQTHSNVIEFADLDTQSTISTKAIAPQSPSFRPRRLSASWSLRWELCFGESTAATSSGSRKQP